MAKVVELIREDEDLSLEEFTPEQMDTSIVGQLSLTEEQERRLKTWLDDELTRAEFEREEFDRKLARWQLAYDAPLPDEPKDFPLANSANLTVPIIKETVNAMTAQFTQTVITPTPRWIIKSDNDEWKRFTGTLERFLDRVARIDMKLDDRLETWILESAKYGTGILEVGYEEIDRKFVVHNRDGSEAREVTVTVKRTPVVYNVPLQHFLIPFSETDPDEAPWCATRLRFNRFQLESKEKNEQFVDVDKVIGEPVKALGGDVAGKEDFGDEDLNIVDELHEDLEDTEPTQRTTWEIHKIWLRFDIDGDGVDDELLVYYHMPTRTILSATYHPYWHRRRPFVILRYFPVEHRFYGQGICEQIEALQEEISEIHNQRLDNASIANVRSIKVRRNSGALKPGDPLFTGQIIEVDELDDLEPFQLGEVYPSTVMNEQITRDYAQRLSGLSEAQLRGGQPVTRTTATAQIALLQEQAKRFDQVVRNARNGIGEIGWFTFMYFFQFGVDESKPVNWLGNRGKVIPAVFSLPFKGEEIGIAFEASAPTSALNRQAQRENLIAVWNLSVQMYSVLLQFAQQVGVPPQALAPVAAELIGSSKKFMFQVMERFDVADPDEAIAGLAVLEKILPKAEDLSGDGSLERRIEETKILEDISRLESLLIEAQGPSEG